MAEKKTKKKKKTAKKPIKKIHSPAKKTPVKTKTKAAMKRKTVAKKPAAQKPAKKMETTSQKPVAKKTLKKPKPKPSKTRKPAPKKTALKKARLNARTKAIKKPGPSVQIAVRKPAGKKSEDERKAALRKALIVKRESIIQEAKAEISKYIKGETRQLVDTALDDGDWSVVDLSEDVSLRQLSTHRENLQKIDEALRKLNEGTYGICEDCSEEISEERLKILPFAIYCIDCQERREQIEQMERREG